MILSVSDATTSVAVATSFAGSVKRSPEQQKQQQHEPSSTSSLSLQSLVALASTLFDQTTLEEKQARKHLEKQQQSNKMDTDDETKHEKHQNKQQSSTLVKGIKRSKPQTTKGTATGQQQRETSSPSVTKNNKTKNNSAITTPQTTNFQCCTRQGFVSRLRSVLDDPSFSGVLSWMPDGKAFTIVSSRKFAKTGMVYELFGIRKMSSFLRRLNQLGFARVRDPTDPTNLDVFRKAGFVRAAAAASDNLQTTAAATTAGAKTKKAQCLESPTSTLQFAPTMPTTDEETDVSASSTGSSSFVSVVAPRTLSPVSSLSSTSTAASLTINKSESSDSTEASSPWIRSTPDPGDLSQQPEPLGVAGLLRSSAQPSVMGVINHHNYNYSHPYPMTLSSMPPSMPASSCGGPVLLRPRGESYDEHSSSVSPPSSAIAAAPLQLPPKPIVPSSETMAKAKTPKTNNRQNSPMLLSTGTLQILEPPNLHHVSSESEPYLGTVPPLGFVSECVRHIMGLSSSEQPAMPMEAGPEKPNEGADECRQETTDHRMEQQNIPPNFGPPYHQHSPILQQQHHHHRDYEYRHLYRAARYEADAALKGNAIQWFGLENERMEHQNRVQWNRMRMQPNGIHLGWHKNQYYNAYNTMERNGMYIHRMIKQKSHGEAQSNGI
jgi:hypothetical protein